jgi:hypothetical protein
MEVEEDLVVQVVQRRRVPEVQRAVAGVEEQVHWGQETKEGKIEVGPAL